MIITQYRSKKYVALRKKKIFSSLLGLSSILIVSSVSEVYSAEVSIVKRKLCYVMLKGPIQKGDAIKIDSAFKNQNEFDLRKNGTDMSVCLNSESGSFLEAFRIFKRLSNRDKGRIGAVVDEGNVCKYACAISFLGGSSMAIEDSTRAFRLLHEKGNLSFGLPDTRPTHGNGKVSQNSASDAFEEGIKTISGLLSHNLTHTKNPNFVPYSFLSKVLELDPGEVIKVEPHNKFKVLEVEYIYKDGKCRSLTEHWSGSVSCPALN